MDDDVSEIVRFYRSANILVTGATGFLGKTLVEKLLRSCGHSLNKIYLIIRTKRDKTVNDRLDDLFSSQIFDTLKIEMPKFREKIACILGDCSQIGFGLSAMDRKHLQARIDIVFHVAASVRFDENLRSAMDINVKGTETVLELAKFMPNLRAIVHVSTAYANCYTSCGGCGGGSAAIDCSTAKKSLPIAENVIDEQFYEFPFKYRSLQTFLSKFPNETINEMQQKILDKWPNTYTFTKAMAENIIRNDRNGLPIGIFRPAIIVSTYREPIIGWVDNLYGPTGIVTAACSGFLSTMYCTETFNANIVPVDMCANALIAVAFDVARRQQLQQRTNEKNVPIYNYVSSCDNPLTWSEYLNLNYLYGRNYPFIRSVWIVNFVLNNNYLWHWFQMIVLHYIPAVIIDTVSVLLFQTPKFLKIYKKIYKFSKVISFFCTNDWQFRNENVRQLWQSLNETDRIRFPFDTASINWLDYFRTYVRGIRVYLTNDPLETLGEARKRQRKFVTIQLVLKTLMILSAVFGLWNFLQILVFGGGGGASKDIVNNRRVLPSNSPVLWSRNYFFKG